MGAEIVVAEDAGGVAIVEIDLDSVVADLGGGIGARLGLVHREERGSGEVRGGGVFFFCALVVASGAGAIVAEIGKIEVAGMAVGPGDVDAGAGFDVDFDVDRFFAVIDGGGHWEVIGNQ